MGALFGGYIAANVLKWHWWRFNGEGYFWGMTSGVVAAIVMKFTVPDSLVLYFSRVVRHFAGGLYRGYVLGTSY